MTPISYFSLEEHEGAYESWPMKSKLLRDGWETDVKIPGYIIEGQFAVGNKFLLVTSYDCPFEETNEFILLDSNLRVVARKWIGAMYCSFSISKLQPVSSHEILINYYGGQQDRLTIRDPKPFFRSYFHFQTLS